MKKQKISPKLQDYKTILIHSHCVGIISSLRNQYETKGGRKRSSNKKKKLVHLSPLGTSSASLCQKAKALSQMPREGHVTWRNVAHMQWWDNHRNKLWSHHKQIKSSVEKHAISKIIMLKIKLTKHLKKLMVTKYHSSSLSLSCQNKSLMTHSWPLALEGISIM